MTVRTKQTVCSSASGQDPEMVGLDNSYNDAVGNRQARRQDSLKNPGLVAFTLGFGYRRKVLFHAIWPPVVDLSWCTFFGLAFASLPFHVKSTTCSHGQFDHQWRWQSHVASEDLIILCCSFCKSLSLGCRARGGPRWPLGSLPTQITPRIYVEDI